MKVLSLIAVTHPAQFNACTLSFSTLRVGFPTADILICINGNSLMQEAIQKKAEKYNLPWKQHTTDYYQPDWIRQVVEVHANPLTTFKNKPITLVEGDMCFFEECESLMNLSLRGMHIPYHFNEWSKCPSMARPHPSLFMIPSCTKLVVNLDELCPGALTTPVGKYQGFNPYSPNRVYLRNEIYYYDTLAMLAEVLFIDYFSYADLTRYAHINSASFYFEMLTKFKDPANISRFERIHQLANKENPDLSAFRDLNFNVLDYYHRQSLIK